MSREIMIEIRGLIGTASPFKQGGSLRITLPKRIARILNLGKANTDEVEGLTLFFIGTSNGILVCTLSDLSRNPALRELVICSYKV